MQSDKQFETKCKKRLRQIQQEILAILDSKPDFYTLSHGTKRCLMQLREEKRKLEAILK